MSGWRQLVVIGRRRRGGGGRALAGGHEGDELVERGDVCARARHHNVLIRPAARERPLCRAALHSASTLSAPTFISGLVIWEKSPDTQGCRQIMCLLH